MRYSLRAVKGAELSRIHFDADSDRAARIMCRTVYDNLAPATELWLLGKVVVVAEDGTILHTYSHCDYCSQITCADDCGNDNE